MSNTDALVNLAASVTAVMYIGECRVFVLVAQSPEDTEMLREVFSTAGWHCCDSTNIPSGKRCVVFADGQAQDIVALCRQKKGRYLIVSPQKPDNGVECLSVDGISSVPLGRCVLAAQGIIDNDDASEERGLLRHLFGLS